MLGWRVALFGTQAALGSPIGTQKNISDLNTKCLSAARRKFLLYMIGAIFMLDGGNFERAGEAEFLEHLMAERLVQQVRHVKTSVRGINRRHSKSLLQLVLFSQLEYSVASADGMSHQTSNGLTVWMRISTLIFVAYFLWKLACWRMKICGRAKWK